MRQALQRRNGDRDLFRGVFVRYGAKAGWHSPETTVLLAPVADASGQPVCDHLWFNLTKQFAALDLVEGDIVEFAGRITPYVKGYQGQIDGLTMPQEIDYKLSRPTKVRRYRWGEDAPLRAVAA